MIFARKMPGYCMIIAWKNIFPEFFGARASCPPSRIRLGSSVYCKKTTEMPNCRLCCWCECRMQWSRCIWDKHGMIHVYDLEARKMNASASSSGTGSGFLIHSFAMTSTRSFTSRRCPIDWWRWAGTVTSGTSWSKSNPVYKHVAVSRMSIFCDLVLIYRLQGESEKSSPPLRFSGIFFKRLGIFQPNFTCLLYVSIYDRLQIFIQLTPTLMKLCHIKGHHPVHIVSAKCPPSVKTHAVFSDDFSQAVGNL